MKSFARCEFPVCILLLIVLVSACKRNEKVGYIEKTAEETEGATKDVFASQNDIASVGVPRSCPKTLIPPYFGILDA